MERKQFQITLRIFVQRTSRPTAKHSMSTRDKHKLQVQVEKLQYI